MCPHPPIVGIDMLGLGSPDPKPAGWCDRQEIDGREGMIRVKTEASWAV